MGLPKYDFLFVFNSNVYPNSPPSGERDTKKYATLNLTFQGYPRSNLMVQLYPCMT